ncbi:MAG: type II toxin-antitoxin system VapC family toxin [Verrucomicrobia subdivision 3 bacterium]|nr:type II toxin-antitoxin system VapC family toxin [Limisphaerales bacterium]
MLTIDANVWVGAQFPNEVNHESSLELLARAAADEIPLHQPTLLPVEIAGAVARRKQVSTEVAGTRHILNEFPGIHFHPLDEEAAHISTSLAADLRLRGADAVYVATAMTSQSTLITLDGEMVKRAANAVTVMTPDEWLAAREN